ncbi:MAG TPA: ComF family protein [Bryobacteraceae bacterium]|nr:ComF family protein [Bryobacteraceae bacterium]
MPVCADCLRAPAPLSAEFFCLNCRTPFRNSFPLDSEGRCMLCRSGRRGFDEAFCYGAYEGALRKLIHLFKYGGMRRLARPLGALLADALPRDRQFDLVTAVPLHWRKRWLRGFNQSELLGKAIARARGIRMRSVLRRQGATRAQAGLSNAQRRENVAGAFRARRRVAGLRILLIDDVMTTGATAGACAVALKKAGARSVSLLTLARVDRRFQDQADAGRRKVPV